MQVTCFPKIRDRYREIAGHGSMDVQLCTYWAKAISEGSKTFEDFDRTLMKSPGYERRVLTLFRQKCAELLGNPNALDARVFQDFERRQVGPVTLESVENFIRNSKPFRNKLADAFDRTCAERLDFRERSTPEIKHACVCLMANNNRCSVEHAIECVSGQRSPFSTRGSEDVHDQPSSCDEKNDRLRNVMANSGAIIIRSADEVLDVFFEVYGRPMFVQEYFYYAFYHPMGACTDAHTWRHVFEEEKPVFQSMINAVTDVHQYYYPRKITQYEIIRRYMFMLREEDVRTSTGLENIQRRVRDALLCTSEYERAMKEESIPIALNYENYENAVNLADKDVDYLFLKLREKSVALTDYDTISTIVKKFKDEMEGVADEISDLYVQYSTAFQKKMKCPLT